MTGEKVFVWGENSAFASERTMELKHTGKFGSEQIVSVPSKAKLI